MAGFVRSLSGFSAPDTLSGILHGRSPASFPVSFRLPSRAEDTQARLMTHRLRPTVHYRGSHSRWSAGAAEAEMANGTALSRVTWACRKGRITELLSRLFSARILASIAGFSPDDSPELFREAATPRRRRNSPRARGTGGPLVSKPCRLLANAAAAVPRGRIETFRIPSVEILNVSAYSYSFPIHAVPFSFKIAPYFSRSAADHGRAAETP